MFWNLIIFPSNEFDVLHQCIFSECNYKKNVFYWIPFSWKIYARFSVKSISVNMVISDWLTWLNIKGTHAKILKLVGKYKVLVLLMWKLGIWKWQVNLSCNISIINYFHYTRRSFIIGFFSPTWTSNSLSNIIWTAGITKRMLINDN